MNLPLAFELAIAVIWISIAPSDTHGGGNQVPYLLFRLHSPNLPLAFELAIAVIWISIAPSDTHKTSRVLGNGSTETPNNIC